MIVFDLSCHEGHRFEGWFASSTDYAEQQARGLLACPSCGSAEVSKAPMAPAVPAKGNTRQEVLPPEAPRQVANTPMPPEVVTTSIERPRGSGPIRANTAWSIELTSYAAVPEWGGQRVDFRTEEDAFFDGTTVRYIDGRQTEITLIPSD